MKPLMNPEQIRLTDERFEDHVRKHRKIVEMTLKLHSPDAFNPTVTVIAIDPESGEEKLNLCALMCPFNEAEEKQQALFMLGKKFYDDQAFVTAIILSCEAWLYVQAKEGWKPGCLMPRDDPNRTEVVIIAGSGISHNSQRHAISIPIKRDENNRMAIDESQEAMDEKTGEFPLLNWFWRGFFDKVINP